MSSFSSPPISPVKPRKRRSLRISSSHFVYDSTSPSLFASGTTSSYQSRRSSQTSIQQTPYSPTTQRSFSIRSKRPSSSRLSIGSNISIGLNSNAGFGNLADELEEALEDGDVPYSPSFLAESQEIHSDLDIHSPVQGTNIYSPASPQSPHPKSTYLEPPEKPPSPSKQWTSMGTPHRKSESFYGGSEHCQSSDDEAFDQIAPTLQRRIRNVGEVAKISSNVEALPELDQVIPRIIAALKDSLDSQPSIENGVTRMVTAYTSMSTHRSHQVREIASISSSLMNSTSFSRSLLNLPPEMLDSLIIELDSLRGTLSVVPDADTMLKDASPLMALQDLATHTRELFTTLQNLTDTLTEHRQHILTATRKLKNVRELVDDLVTEEELVETSMLLIQAGDWDRRCRERHARKVVEEVMEGFKRTWGTDSVDGDWGPGVRGRDVVAVG